MPKFVIERDLPNAGNLSKEELQALSQKSCGILREMGPDIQWMHSYVTKDKLYCIYVAPDEQRILEHANKGGFPANRIEEINTELGPTIVG